jgi:wyosine [tRNA(Phe)-imidazoG37] synthetase (radical SAM superfamily)
VGVGLLESELCANACWYCARELGEERKKVLRWCEREMRNKIGEYFHSPKLFGESNETARSNFLVFLSN